MLCFALAVGSWSPFMHVDPSKDGVLQKIQNKTTINILSDTMQDTTYDTPPGIYQLQCHMLLLPICIQCSKRKFN